MISLFFGSIFRNKFKKSYLKFLMVLVSLIIENKPVLTSNLINWRYFVFSTKSHNKKFTGKLEMISLFWFFYFIKFV